MQSHGTRLVLTVILLTLSSTGCKVGGLFQRWAQQAADSSDVASAEAALLAVASEDLSPAMTGDEAARKAADAVTRFYRPAGCATATVDGDTVTFVLDDCTGPYGLVHVTGTVTVEYSRAGDGIAYHASSTGLDVNGAIVDFDSDGMYRQVGGAHTITGTFAGEGVGPRGHTLRRSGQRTVTWEPQGECISVDGSWMTEVERLRWTTTVEDVRRCSQRCPDAGGSITWENARNSLTVEFDGSDEANWHTARGREGTVSLFCE